MTQSPEHAQVQARTEMRQWYECVSRFPSHEFHTTRTIISIYAQLAMHLFCFFALFLSTSWQVLSLSLSPHTVSHVAAGIGVNCRGRSSSLFQTGSVGEERALASLQRSPPHILSPSLSLHKATFSTVAYQTSKMSEVFMSFSFPSLVCLFLDFWEHWFLQIQMQHTELIKLMRACTNSIF